MLYCEEALPEKTKTEAYHRDSSDNNDLLGVGTWDSGAQHTGGKGSSTGGSETSPVHKKDKMSASLARWVDDSQDDPWSHVTRGKSGKPAGGAGMKHSKA